MLTGTLTLSTGLRKRIVIVDSTDSIILLQHFIQESSSIKLINTYNSMEDAIKNIKNDKPDLIITEVDLEGLSGVDGIFEIAKINSGISVLVLTSILNLELLTRAFTNGATGYLLKSESLSKINHYLDNWLIGGAPISPSPAKVLIQSMRRNPSSPLSHRETEVVKHLMKGNTYEEIAQILSISRDTIKTHLRNIYRKLGVRSRSMVIKIAMEDRLI